MKTGAFTSERAREAFATACTAMLDELWPTREDRDVPTAFGTTRVMSGGAPSDVPFVLLPGAGGNSLMWHRYVGPLGARRTVVAIDPPGEPGLSTLDKPFTGGPDLAAWLEEVLAALAVPRAHLVSCSYGGWIAVQHALHHPGRTASLTLLDPAGLGRFTPRFIAWVIAGGLAGLTPPALRRRLAAPLRNATLRDEHAMRMVRLSMRYRRHMPLPAPLSDAELTALTAPLQLLLGERSTMYDVRAVAARVTALLPAAHVEIIPGASHDVPMYAPDLVTARTLAFTEAAAGHP